MTPQERYKAQLNKICGGPTVRHERPVLTGIQKHELEQSESQKMWWELKRE